MNKKQPPKKKTKKAHAPDSDRRYQTLLESVNAIVWEANAQTFEFTYVSPQAEGILGYPPAKWYGSGGFWQQHIHPEDREWAIQYCHEKTCQQENHTFEYRMVTADQRVVWLRDHVTVISREGKPDKLCGMMIDITGRKKVEKEEQKWLQLFESAIASTTESVAILEGQASDQPGRKILYINDAFSHMTGYAPEEVVGETLHLLNGPYTSRKGRQKLSWAMDNREVCETELINYKKNGDPFWIHVSMTPVAGTGDSNFWVCVGRDVTERRERETTLRESLKEKETLLLEIHHRVKNNLAVVSGMMQLQAFEEEDEVIKSKLFDSVARIQSMASIHELLYQSKSFSKLDFDKNIKSLVSNITNTFNNDLDLDVHFDMDHISLNINQALPCSLMVNEVVTNVLKHAFDYEENSKLYVQARKEGEQIQVCIRDNGKGLPPDFNQKKNKGSLGLQLITTLARQLEAEYSYRSISQGTEFCLSFQKTNVKGIGNAGLA